MQLLASECQARMSAYQRHMLWLIAPDDGPESHRRARVMQAQDEIASLCVAQSGAQVSLCQSMRIATPSDGRFTVTAELD